jgi:two-component system, sensor histidine kinase LadS
MKFLLSIYIFAASISPKIATIKNESVKDNTKSFSDYYKEIEAVHINSSDEIISIGPDLKVFLDENEEITIQRLISNFGMKGQNFSLSKQESPNFQMTPAPAWCFIKLKNNLSEPVFLEVGSSFLDSLILYTVDNEGVFETYFTGDRAPFKQRDLKNNNFFFKLNLKSGEDKLFVLKVKCHKPLQFPVNAGTIKAFYERDHVKDFVHGIFYGFMILMVLYNLMFYLSIKDKVYLLYIFYVGSVTLFISYINGYSFEFLWPENPWLNDHAAISTALTILAALLFTMNFLNLKKYSLRLKKINLFLLVLPIIIIILSISGYRLQGIMFSQVSLLVTSLFFIISGITVYRKGYKPAKFYMGAWSILITSIVVLILKDVDLLPYNIFTINSLQIGASLEVLLLSIAVADKINIYKKEKEEAQLLALKTLQEKESYIEGQNRLLEEKVKERTKQLQEKNLELNIKNKEIIDQAEAILSKSMELEFAYENITDSLKYAKRIQQAIFGDLDYITSRFSESFILFKPRDIVSGDFYWYAERDSLKFIVAADCTGHGVPGAFMTVMGNDFLNDIILHKGIIDPGDILSAMDQMIISTIQQKNSGSIPTHDGMDLSILVFDEANKMVHYSGAKNVLYLIKDNNLEQIKGNRFPIGSVQYYTRKKFKTHSIELNSGDLFYIFSDGYQDQFGGNINKKFLSKNFRNLLLSVSHLPLNEQKIIIEDSFNKWKGFIDQTDDILIIGIRYLELNQVLSKPKKRKFLNF